MKADSLPAESQGKPKYTGVGRSRKFACNAGDTGVVGSGLIPGSGIVPGGGNGNLLQYPWASLVGQLVKNLPEMWETWVQSLGWEDPLEKGKATHSIFWPGESHGLYSPWQFSRPEY